MNDMKFIKINKNRGWRGLAEVQILNEDKDITTKHIFSFSPDMWDDLINDNRVVIASEKYYYIIHFSYSIRGLLPKPTQQRSVLIKNFMAEIDDVKKYEKDKWTSAEGSEYFKLLHFMKNRNNHTTSDWNCIGIRVIPEI